MDAVGIIVIIIGAVQVWDMFHISRKHTTGNAMRQVI